MTDDELNKAFWAWLEREHPGSVHDVDMRDIAEAAWDACAAVVREHDGRDAERWRFWCANSYLFGVLLPFRGPDDMNAQIDAAIARGKE